MGAEKIEDLKLKLADFFSNPILGVEKERVRKELHMHSADCALCA